MSDSDEPRRGPSSPEIFRALVEYGLDAVILTDEDLRVRYVSSAIRDVLGFEPEEVVGRTGFEFSHPEDEAVDRANFEEVLRTPGKRLRFEFRGRHRDCSYRDMEIHARNLLDEPSVGGIVCTIRDVTEQRRSERLQRQQQERLRLFADNARDIIAIYELQPAPHMAYISPSVERITGYEQRRFYDDPMLHFAIIHPDDRQRLLDLHGNLGEGEAITLRWIRADGEPAWIEQVIVPVRDEAGNVVRTHAVGRDVTEKVRLEEQLQKAQRLEALGQLAARMAHEFNNLLSVALLSTSRLERMTEDQPRLRTEAGYIRDAVERGVALTRQLLARRRHEPGPEIFEAAGAAAAVEPLAAGTVVLVEDDPLLRQLAEAYLRGAGYEVRSAEDGLAALAVIDELAGVDLLLTDMAMPRMSGAELARRVLERFPQAAVLLMSGYGVEDFGAVEIAGWPVRFLAKPFTDQQLLGAVRTALAEAELRAAAE